MTNLKSHITQTIVAKEYMRLAIINQHPDAEPVNYGKIDQDLLDKYKNEGLALASDLFFELRNKEYLRSIDDFSVDHIAPVVTAKYG